MMANNRKAFLDSFAKFLIFLSFFIFVVGFSYDSFSNKKKINLDNKSKIQDNGSSISITTTDDHPVVDSSNTDIVNDDNYTNTQDSNNYVEDNNSSNTSNTNNGNNSNNSNNKVINKANDLDVVNDKLRKEIENEYNVKVFYGNETAGYSVSGISTAPISNSTVVNSSLIHLKNALSLYPKGIFKEISDGGIPLSIYLINNYEEDNITGVTDSSYSYANISIAVTFPFEESFYHESYHYIERYMFKNGASFENWGSLNPPGFEYGTIINDLSYSNTFSESSPFVNNYAQYDDKEDRASTFEYMMASSKASCLNNGQTVWKKAMLMSRTMDAVFNSVSPNVVEYWERFLY